MRRDALHLGPLEHAVAVAVVRAEDPLQRGGQLVVAAAAAAAPRVAVGAVAPRREELAPELALAMRPDVLDGVEGPRHVRGRRRQREAAPLASPAQVVAGQLAVARAALAEHGARVEVRAAVAPPLLELLEAPAQPRERGVPRARASSPRCRMCACRTRDSSPGCRKRSSSARRSAGRTSSLPGVTPSSPASGPDRLPERLRGHGPVAVRVGARQLRAQAQEAVLAERLAEPPRDLADLAPRRRLHGKVQELVVRDRARRVHVQAVDEGPPVARAQVHAQPFGEPRRELVAVDLAVAVRVHVAERVGDRVGPPRRVLAPDGPPDAPRAPPPPRAASSASASSLLVAVAAPPPPPRGRRAPPPAGRSHRPRTKRSVSTSPAPSSSYLSSSAFSSSGASGTPKRRSAPRSSARETRPSPSWSRAPASPSATLRGAAPSFPSFARTSSTALPTLASARRIAVGAQSVADLAPSLASWSTRSRRRSARWSLSPKAHAAGPAASGPSHLANAA